jgi:uncharacterized protein YbcI
LAGEGYDGSVTDPSDDAIGTSTELERGDSLLSRISTEMVRAMKEFYGKGPMHAKSYFIDDLLFVVMRGGMTQSEQTMLNAGHQDTVRQFRQEFENEMTEPLSQIIEQLTGRHVINYQSQVLFDPNMNVEIFVFDEPAGAREREESAEAIKGTKSQRAVALSEQVQHPNPPKVS